MISAGLLAGAEAALSWPGCGVLVKMLQIMPVALAIIILITPPGAAADRLPQAGRSASQDAGAPADGRTELVETTVVCRFVNQPPVLDGKLNDACWKKAQPIKRFAAYWAKEPRPGTISYLVWDDDALYYAAQMQDQELRSFGARNNDILWNGDVFELFFKPAAASPRYYEFQANPRGFVFELAFSARGQNQGDPARAAPLGSRAAVEMAGTLDQAGDVDRGWTVEGRIPWSAFEPSGGKPAAGTEWRFALCRYDHGKKGTKPLLSSCAPLTQPSFHRHEDYARLRFEGPGKAP